MPPEPARVSPANVTLPPPLAADASLGREDLFRMMLVGAGGAGAAACLLLFVVEPPRCSWRCCCDGGTAAADMVGIGMTLGMVMSVRSGAGPASTESTGTLTRLGIADGRIGTFGILQYESGIGRHAMHGQDTKINGHQCQNVPTNHPRLVPVQADQIHYR